MRNILMLIALAVTTLPLPAQDKPRHYDFTVVLKGFDGKPLMNGDAKPAMPLTLSDVAVNAIEGTLPSDPTGIAAGSDKLKRDKLALRIYLAKDVTLSAAEVAYIVERIGESPYPAIVMGAAVRVLDPAQE